MKKTLSDERFQELFKNLGDLDFCELMDLRESCRRRKDEFSDMTLFMNKICDKKLEYKKPVVENSVTGTLLLKDLRLGLSVNIFEGKEKVDEVIIREIGDTEDFLTKKVKVESKLLFPGGTQEFVLISEILSNVDAWVMIFDDPFIAGKKVFSRNSPSYKFESVQ